MRRVWSCLHISILLRNSVKILTKLATSLIMIIFAHDNKYMNFWLGVIWGNALTMFCILRKSCVRWNAYATHSTKKLLPGNKIFFRALFFSFGWFTNLKMINKSFSGNSHERCGEKSREDTYTNVVNEQLMQNIHDPEFLIKHQGLCSMKPVR